jgi:EAL domain-containing protein (putative c-di-GMP-specific phosphodiesterase class I)
MQELTALEGGQTQVARPTTPTRAPRGRPLDVSFARRLHAYKDELAVRERRAIAEEQDLQFLRARLDRVQAAFQEQRLVPVFQPIVDLRTRAATGCEALSRFQLEPLRSPDQWFAEAEAAGLGLELEMHAIRSAVDSRDRLPSNSYLSVNASPKTLLSQEFATLVSHLDGEFLVVEVTEHSAVTDYDALKHAIDQLRGRGVRLAIDDLGTGFASFMHIVKLLPEFMKLDLSLTRGIESDPVKQALTAALVGFAAQIGAQVIAEGVETAEELETLVELNVEYAQGYYLGAPAALPLFGAIERGGIQSCKRGADVLRIRPRVMDDRVEDAAGASEAGC